MILKNPPPDWGHVSEKSQADVRARLELTRTALAPEMVAASLEEHLPTFEYKVQVVIREAAARRSGAEEKLVWWGATKLTDFEPTSQAIRRESEIARLLLGLTVEHRGVKGSWREFYDMRSLQRSG